MHKKANDASDTVHVLAERVLSKCVSKLGIFFSMVLF